MFRTVLGFIFAIAAAFTVLGTASGALAQSSYRLQPGDVLQVEVLEDTSLNRSALVLPDGSISFPLVGTIPAAGRSVDDVRAALSAGLASNFAAPPNVFVSVGTLGVRTSTASAPRTVAVYALGEVTSPGRKDVAAGTTLLQFLAESGGLTRFAATKRIQLRRVDRSGTEQVYTFNYAAVQGGAKAGGNTALQSGDVVIVPERKLFE